MTNTRPHTMGDSAHTGQGYSPGTTKERQRQTNDWGSGSPIDETYNILRTTSTPSPAMLTAMDDLTDDDIRAHIITWMEAMDSSGQHAWCFENADEQPPITPAFLAELDQSATINNPRLRHDLNFDRDLQLKPNPDSRKGRRKMEREDRYWRALVAELSIHNISLRRRVSSSDNGAYWGRIWKSSFVRLPKLLAAIRDILKILVPDHDQETVQEWLDVDLIMQQVQMRVFDPANLGNWLAKFLKKHCAPIRDPLVDSMQSEIEQGARGNSPRRLVDGLRQLMNLFETMKLDVANFHLRDMRRMLIHDTINFERRYNAHRMKIGKIRQVEVKRWIDNVQPLGLEPSLPSDIARGLVQDLLYNDNSSFCPSAFCLDYDRLRALRVELHSRVYYATCLDVFRELASSTISKTDLARAREALQGSLAAIIGADGEFLARRQNVAAEIVRVLLVAEGKYPPFDAERQELAEQRLSDCSTFRPNAKALAEMLIPKIQSRVEDYVQFSALTLHDAFVPQVPSQRNSMGFGAVCEPPSPETDFGELDPYEAIIRRLTHIIVLHWKVWADLVYLVDPQTEDDIAPNSTIIQSQQGSRTVPVARAVYAPGRVWPADRVENIDVPVGPTTPSPSSDPEQGSHQKNYALQ